MRMEEGEECNEYLEAVTVQHEQPVALSGHIGFFNFALNPRSAASAGYISTVNAR